MVATLANVGGAVRGALKLAVVGGGHPMVSCPDRSQDRLVGLQNITPQELSRQAAEKEHEDDGKQPAGAGRLECMVRLW